MIRRLGTRRRGASFGERLAALLGAATLAAAGLGVGSLATPAPATAAYCDDFPFLCLTYTVEPMGNGAGTVTTSDGFISCRWQNGAKSGTCSKRYVKDAQGQVHVPLTVTADPGSYACYVPYCELDSVSITPIISGDFTDYSPKLAVDACTPQVWTWCSTLSFAMTGPASGSIETTDGHISCSRANGATTGTCSHQYFVGPPGTVIQVGWAYEAPPGVRMCEDPETCSSGSGTVTRNFYPNDDEAYTYSFEYYVYTLTVAVGGSGAGSVTSNPSGISCGAACSDTYHYDDAVRLTASPQPGSRFESWTGPCAGQDATCDLKVRDSATIVATFLPVGATSPPATARPGSSAVPGTTASPTSPAPSPAASSPGPSESAVAATTQPSESPGGESAGPSAGAIRSDPPPLGTASPTAPAVGTATGPDTMLIVVAIVVAGLLIGIGLALGLRRRQPKPAGETETEAD